MSEDTDTEGKRLLVAHIADPVNKSSQSEVARACGVKPSSVFWWCDGKSRPTPHCREVMELLYKIPREAWLTSSERALIDKARMNASAR